MIADNAEEFSDIENSNNRKKCVFKNLSFNGEILKAFYLSGINPKFVEIKENISQIQIKYCDEIIEIEF